ncbi:MAG TPA: hypothetical protein VGR35_14190 [Tepidisphaeraceae bacterium]|nr:hypothetical protein [Tepidisphaeraceae bacterium]
MGFMSLVGGEIARRDGDDLHLRAQPLRPRWTLSDLASADGHRLTCTFTCSVVAVDRPADRKMLAETFLAGRDVIEPADIVNHFKPALMSAASQLAATRPADAWLSPASERTMAEALRTSAAPVAFACGIELLPPFEVQLTSPSVERQRMEAMERRLAERRAEWQAEHFQRAAELLRSFETQRAASPGVSIGRVLEAVSAADRGPMLQTLLAASASPDAATSAELWAVGGMGLARVEPVQSKVTIEPMDRPAEVGPPRSLRADEVKGEPVWVIGCRTGVLIVRAQDRKVLAALRDEGVPTSLGFSRAVVRGCEVIACHSEAGIVRWRTDRPESPTTTWRPLPGEQPRNLCALDSERLAYSSGLSVVLLHNGERTTLPPESSRDIVSLLLSERDLFVVYADGEVVRKDRATLQTHERSRHCGPVSSAALLPWVGGVRLLLATLDGPVCCIGVEDSVVTQYVSPLRGLKALATTNGLVAGISADRQRIVLWNSWDGRSPIAEINIAARTRHHVADIAFAPPVAAAPDTPLA